MEAVAQSNSSSGNAILLEAKVFTFIMTSIPCSIFLIINGTILYILQSKPMFREVPRYNLLFNMAMGDTLLILQAQTIYLLSTFQIFVSYPLCAFLCMLSYLTCQISPLTLIVMSLERYVAVCFPFRHSTLVTLKNTGFSILLIWMLSCLDTVVRVLLLLQFPFRDFPSLQMNKFCAISHMSLSTTFVLYELGYSCFLFIFSGLVIISSFIGVLVVARSATDKSSTDKTRNTLLLHMFQLGLILLSMLNVHLFNAASKWTEPGAIGMLYVAVYVCAILMPRCLSALTYGLRDPFLRPALGTHFCCTVQLRVGWVQVQRLLNGQRHKCHPRGHLTKKSSNSRFN